MKYEVFKKKVLDLVSKIGCSVSFRRVDGRYVAYCSDGTTIVGNQVSPSVCVKWGSGHSAIVAI